MTATEDRPAVTAPDAQPGHDVTGPLRQLTVAPRLPGTLRDDRWPDRLALVALLASLFVLVVALVPPWQRYFGRGEDAVSITSFVVVPNVVYAALLLVLALGLRRRLRAAWWVLFVGVIVLPQLGRIVRLAAGDARPLYWVGLAVMTVVGILLVLVRRQFDARSQRGALWRASVILVVGALATCVIGAALIRSFGQGATFAAGLRFTFDYLLGDIGVIANDPSVLVPRWMRVVIALVGAVAVLGTAFTLFRAPAYTHFLDATAEARVRAMLRDHGEDSLGYFATRRDKSVVWDDSGGGPRAGVSYRVVNGVSLASGDPLGDPERWPTAIEVWRSQARDNGWSLAVMGAGEQAAQAYAEAGLVALELGDEAIVDLRAFSLNAAGMKAVRQAVSRVRRQGYTARVTRHSALTPADFARLDEAAGRWRGDGGDERGFSMALGRLGDPLDGDCLLVEAMDETERLRGFLSLVPWGRTGVSLDLMRRDPTAGNGLIEFMVAALAEHGPARGVGTASLNFAMFREAFERGAQLGAGPIARAWRQALLLASRNWQLESLYRSNAKYQPEWKPRFICFEYVSDLGRVGVAAGSAEGFLTTPSLAILRGRAKTDQTLDPADSAYAAQVRSLLPPEPDALAEALSTRHLPEQMRVRRAKLDRLRSLGIEPYPVGYPRTHTLAQVRAAHPDLPPDSRTGARVGVVGRVILKRDGGRLCFATLRDGSGDLQVMVEVSAAGEQTLDRWRHDIDLGDHVGVTGEVVTTRRGELSVRADSFALTCKSLRPLPDKHKGLADPEARVRLRYVDLIVRPEARDMAYLRSTVVRSIRDSLHRRGYVEAETPILQVIHGGANARPFETHINAYDLDLCLRIATELHLKRLLVGGIERVFEVGRQFRNEGADSTHNPEFTSLEAYETYGDYDTMRVLTQGMIQEAATAVFGSPMARRMQPDGSVEEYDLSGDWPVLTVCEAVSRALGEEVTMDTPYDVLARHADRLGLDYDPAAGFGLLLEELYEELCESRTTTPVFYKDYPKENAPLTRAHRHDPRLAEKWDLVCWGAEQGTAYSELVDPVDQRARLVSQSLLAAAGDAEAMRVDEDFLRALEYGMPPSGGMGMGVDRLVMTLTGLGIRDTILFPLVRPE